MYTSFNSGVLYKIEVPEVNIQAGIIASEAFFAPLISTFPDIFFSPLITNLSTFPLVIAEVNSNIKIRNNFNYLLFKFNQL